MLVYGGHGSYTRQGVEVTDVSGLEPLLTRLEAPMTEKLDRD